MTQTQTEHEIESAISRAQSQGIDLYEVLSKREYGFLSGRFIPNNNYARRLRFSIRQKLSKMLRDCNAFPNKNMPATLSTRVQKVENYLIVPPTAYFYPNLPLTATT